MQRAIINLNDFILDNPVHSWYTEVSLCTFMTDAHNVVLHSVVLLELTDQVLEFRGHDDLPLGDTAAVLTHRGGHQLLGGHRGVTEVLGNVQLK